MLFSHQPFCFPWSTMRVPGVLRKASLDYLDSRQRPRLIFMSQSHIKLLQFFYQRLCQLMQRSRVQSLMNSVMEITASHTFSLTLWSNTARRLVCSRDRICSSSVKTLVFGYLESMTFTPWLRPRKLTSVWSISREKHSDQPSQL